LVALLISCWLLFGIAEVHVEPCRVRCRQPCLGRQCCLARVERTIMVSRGVSSHAFRAFMFQCLFGRVLYLTFCLASASASVGDCIRSAAHVFLASPR
jgi:hypothetical protein